MTSTADGATVVVPPSPNDTAQAQDVVTEIASSFAHIQGIGGSVPMAKIAKTIVDSVAGASQAKLTWNANELKHATDVEFQAMAQKFKPSNLEASDMTSQMQVQTTKLPLPFALLLLPSGIVKQTDVTQTQSLLDSQPLPTHCDLALDLGLQPQVNFRSLDVQRLSASRIMEARNVPTKTLQQARPTFALYCLGHTNPFAPPETASPLQNSNALLPSTRTQTSKIAGQKRMTANFGCDNTMAELDALCALLGMPPKQGFQAPTVKQELRHYFDYLEYVFTEIFPLDTVRGWQALYLHLRQKSNYHCTQIPTIEHAFPDTWPLLFLGTVQILQVSSHLRLAAVDGLHTVVRLKLWLLNAGLDLQDGSCGLSALVDPDESPFSIDSVEMHLKRLGSLRDSRFCVAAPGNFHTRFRKECLEQSASILRSNKLAQASGWSNLVTQLVTKASMDASSTEPPSLDKVKQRLVQIIQHEIDPSLFVEAVTSSIVALKSKMETSKKVREARDDETRLEMMTKVMFPGRNLGGMETASGMAKDCTHSLLWLISMACVSDPSLLLRLVELNGKPAHATTVRVGVAPNGQMKGGGDLLCDFNPGFPIYNDLLLPLLNYLEVVWKFATKPQSESSRPTKAGLEERLFPDMLRILCRLGLWLDPPSHSRDRNKLEEGIQKLSRLWELERKEFPSVQKRMGSTLHVLLAFLARLVECKVVKVALTKTKLEYELADHTYTSTEEVVAALVSGEFKGNAQSVESAWHTISGVWETESFDPTQVWEGIAKGRKRPPRATPAGQATESEVPANLNTNIGPRPTSPRQQASGEASRGEDPSQSLQGQPKGACRRSKRSRISPSLLLAEAAGLAQEGTSSRKRKRRKNTNSTPMAEATDDPETNLEILTNDTNHAEDSSTLVSSPAFSRASTAQQSSSSSSQSVASLLTQPNERTRPACDGMDNDSAMGGNRDDIEGEHTLPEREDTEFNTTWIGTAEPHESLQEQGSIPIGSPGLDLLARAGVDARRDSTVLEGANHERTSQYMASDIEEEARTNLRLCFVEQWRRIRAKGLRDAQVRRIFDQVLASLDQGREVGNDVH